MSATAVVAMAASSAAPMAPARTELRRIDESPVVLNRAGRPIEPTRLPPRRVPQRRWAHYGRGLDAGRSQEWGNKGTALGLRNAGADSCASLQLRHANRGHGHRE